MSAIKRLVFSSVLLLSCLPCAWGATSFVVQNIQIEGLQRVSRGTFLSYMPIKQGEQLDAAETTQVIQNLYKTGFFSNISLLRHNNTLIIKVVERPTMVKCLIIRY